MTSSRVSTLLCCVLLVLATGAAAEDSETTATTLPIGGWLRLGPVTTPLPAFDDADKAGFAVSDLLATPPPAGAWLWPAAGDVTPLCGRSGAKWRTVGGETDIDTDDDLVSEVWQAVYLASDRWLKADLTLGGTSSLRAWLDGEKIDLADGDDEDGTSKTATLKLAIGTHVLLIHGLDDPADTTASAEWRLTGSVGIDGELPTGALAVTTDPTRHVDIGTILDAPRFGTIAISADGLLVAATLSEYDAGGRRDTWLEVRNADNGRLKTSWRGGLDLSGLQWLPDGHRLSYVAREDGAATVWIHDLDTGSTSAVLSDVADFGRYAWGPDGDWLIHSVRVEAEAGSDHVKRVKHPADRQSWFRDRSYLVQVAVPGGATRRLTAGPLSPGSWRISPDGKELLFFLSEPDMESRPYYTSQLWVMDLATLETEMLLDDRWIDSAAWGPDDDLLALGGSPSAFDGLGRNLPDGVQANDYGGQLYLYNRRTGHAEAASVDFTPAIGSFEWSRSDDRIYATCTDGQTNRVHAFDPDGQDWSTVETGLENTDDFAIAEKASRAVAAGCGANYPFRLTGVDLKRGRASELLDPGADRYRDIAFGEVETWTCELPQGGVLDGFVYYPPDYDAARKYPLIVYYYGGTSPITRDFGGRYPKNIWAGQGYIVYVPNPSGATGYGQEFAARHVNDWGILTAGEVIEGTKRFLADHPSVDPARVGCAGASYGGFLTEYIITQSDIFACAISHAGISSISSYWGEGMWGYVYGARALADAFPWQDRELYIEQSPLFLADQITTPLLLLHGDSDINVPLGESDQLFTALKLLGREVEYVQVLGQDHHILDHEKRIVWNDTILAYFAKWLKGRDAWWEEMYGE